jgi:hypothetical protein
MLHVGATGKEEEELVHLVTINGYYKTPYGVSGT